MKIFPENISTYGAEIDSLFYVISAFVLIAFVITLFLLIYPLFKYRYKADRKSTRVRGDNNKQLKWIFIALGLLAMCDFYMLYAEHGTWAKIEEQLPEQKDLHIVATGRQWNWVFTYPGPDNVLYTGDDVVVNQQNSELHVPVNKNIIVDIKATDVLHSFFIKNTRLKQDAIPGRTITRWFNATKTGTYEIACAEICGILHSKMRNFLVVESEDDFNNYISELYKPEEN